MKIYDISQEVFSSEVYPGDPKPQKYILSSMANGENYNLSAFYMCAHNGTHIDAPFHFINDGETIEQIPVEKYIGPCFVAEYRGVITGNDAINILKKAGNDASKRILIKGNAVVSPEAAEVFANARIVLIGSESQSVGDENEPMVVHKALLKENVVLLEGIRLSQVMEGEYILCAAPLMLAGCDGAPCRAILIKLDNS